MTHVQLVEQAVIDGASVRMTRDGYIVARAKTARTGIQLYSARELGLTDRPATEMVRVYRPPEEVFHKDAMASMAHRPVTVDHPPEMVTAKNWKRYSGGITGGEIVRDGDFVDVPLTLMDQVAIDAYEAGKRQLSWGYTSDIELGDGVSPEGENYQAIQRNIRCNHLATCDLARGGPDLRLGDRQPARERHPMSDIQLKTIMVDGLQVQTTDAGEAAINKLKGMLDTSAKALETALADATSAKAKFDADLALKDKEIEDLKAKVPDAAALDALATGRAKLISDAKAMAGDDLVVDGKSDAEIRKAAVSKVLGDNKVTGKDDAFFTHAFDGLVIQGAKAGGQSDPIRDAITGGLSTADADKAANEARDAMIAELRGDKPADKKAA